MLRPATPLQRLWLRTLHRFGRLLMCTVYRLRTRGFEDLPDGAAVLVSNHVSFIDFMFVGVALPEVPRYVMHHHHWRYAPLRWFFRSARVIPIAPRKESPELLARAMEAIDAALARGEKVLIWPEGGMTPDGELRAFRPGVERIVARREVPVIPIAIRGAWQSALSRNGGEPLTKLPRRVRLPIELVADPPVPAPLVDASRLRARIAVLRGAMR